jgi:hypothetical protein
MQQHPFENVAPSEMFQVVIFENRMSARARAPADHTPWQMWPTTLTEDLS